MFATNFSRNDTRTFPARSLFQIAKSIQDHFLFHFGFFFVLFNFRSLRSINSWVQVTCVVCRCSCLLIEEDVAQQELASRDLITLYSKIKESSKVQLLLSGIFHYFTSGCIRRRRTNATNKIAFSFSSRAIFPNEKYLSRRFIARSVWIFPGIDCNYWNLRLIAVYIWVASKQTCLNKIDWSGKKCRLTHLVLRLVRSSRIRPSLTALWKMRSTSLCESASRDHPSAGKTGKTPIIIQNK